MTLRSVLRGQGSVVSSLSGVWGNAPVPDGFFLFLQRNETYSETQNENYWGSWLDDPQGQNIGGSSPSEPTKSADMTLGRVGNV